ncbi:MAG TPA: protein kinase [Candidatus Acidoferrales bacterium]|nr:protein kinase [Candidatus Acidoferrales bacterium]
MALNPGTRLGPYEIVAGIGAGGMGEVYRARDTRLDRTVAIKVLPQHLAETPEARQRFEREARAVSALNHPHICTLYDVGTQNGTDFLVMEYIEGETLAARIDKGSLLIKELLEIGIQIADALDKAHRGGIIHRDLKPGNIMVTKQGVKLLDFGLAKAVDTSMATGSTLSPTAPPERKSLTERGMVVGTFQYMSPEQLEGKELDSRSDIFSFGAVLYEMATGRNAFSGASRASIIAAILTSEPPPIGALQPLSPPALDRAVRQCLAKNPEDRWQTARDLLLELKWIEDAGMQAGVPPADATHHKTRERTLSAIAAVLGVIAIALAIGYVQRAPKPAQLMPPVRLNAELGADASLSEIGYGADAVLSPDGARMVFVAEGTDKKQRLYIRSLDQMRATVLLGTEEARDPFFSPDGQWIAFFAGGRLKKISVQGGEAFTLCDAPNERGGSWGDTALIVFAPGVATGLSKVSSAGGTPEPFTVLDSQNRAGTHRWPQFLPGGKDVLFTFSPTGIGFDDADIVAYSAASGKSKTVLHGGSYAHYVPSGYLVYERNNTLFAAPFDLQRLEVTGKSAPVLGGVATTQTGGALFSVSDSGTLMYVGGSAANPDASIYWMDASGKFTPLRETPGNYHDLGVSPDGKRLAMDITNGDRTDIWVDDWERDALTRLTFSADQNYAPVWTPDGQRIVYASAEKGEASNLWWIRADGGGDAQRLTESKDPQSPSSWSPDGKVLAFSQSNPGTGWGIVTLTVEGSEKSGWKLGQPTQFVNSPSLELLPALSPDGHWIAYMSNESGMYEIYVRPFPGPGGKWQVSNGGGHKIGGWGPEWSRNGNELLFFVPSSHQIMAVSYASSGDSFRADKPHLWSPGQFADRRINVNNPNFSLHPDGKRIAVLRTSSTESGPPPIKSVSFIFNFFDELRRKVPAGKN